jgi:hypothetical protein
MKTTKFTLSAIAAVVLGFGATTNANAAPITELFFSQAAGFLDLAADANPATYFDAASGLTFNGMNTPTGGSPYPTGTYGGMSWSGTGQYGYTDSSSLSLTTFTSAGTVEISGNGNSKWESGEQWVITNIHQINNPLVRAIDATISDPLWVADIAANLRIFSDAVGGNLVHDELNSTTRVKFNETFNQYGNAGQCSYGNPWTTACDDIYTVALNTFAPTTFWIDSTEYQLSFGLVPGALASPGSNAVVCPSADPRCVGISVAPGTIQVFTPEVYPGESDIYVTMAWQAIPEPGSMALSGLGLLALSAFRRRKNVA